MSTSNSGGKASTEKQIIATEGTWLLLTGLLPKHLPFYHRLVWISTFIAETSFFNTLIQYSYIGAYIQRLATVRVQRLRNRKALGPKQDTCVTTLPTGARTGETGGARGSGETCVSLRLSKLCFPDMMAGLLHT